ncbi:DUF3899 domain-containing protein [Planococcus lenghuensis]|uniref:DUF3899 domain-containing protein n=1 Tax=Planococcus lenghuensis TaxID=2213202 RepID=A0A1Q2L3Z5_9BACL|nr:DUF3899 domain-containing protein [Planococcus lenghuensis]AQQ54592.1 hypothetical protein B0X71_16775 [Planococcus lenghuensis]
MKKVSFLYLFFVLVWAGIVIRLQWSALEVINGAFMVGLITAIIAASIKIMQSGFLELFLDGFQRLGQAVTGRSNAMERADEQLKQDASLQEFKRSMGDWLFHTVVACSIVSFALSIAGLWMYY